jgi:hypothetical protein
MSNNIRKASELLSFIKERLAADLSEAQAKNMFKIEIEELKKLISLAEMSIDNNFSKSVDTIFSEK